MSLVKIAVLLIPAAIVLLLDLLPADGLAYDRSGIAAGELWRMITGSFVHFTRYHSWMNALGLAACALFLFNEQSLRRWFLVFGSVLAGVGLGLFLFDADLEEYRGMSGAVYGMLAAGLVLNYRHNPLLYSAILLVLAAKIAYEQLPLFDPNYLLDQIGVPVAAGAHLYGALTGVCVAMAMLAVTRRGRNASSE